MKVDVLIKKDLPEPRLIIETSKMTQEIETIISVAQGSQKDGLTAYLNEKVYILPFFTIERIYAQDQKIFLQTNVGKEFRLKFRLYQIEELLPSFFVRISGSEIVNINLIDHLDLSFSGTIKVIFKSKTSTYVSRRFLTKVKDALSI